MITTIIDGLQVAILEKDLGDLSKLLSALSTDSDTVVDYPTACAVLTAGAASSTEGTPLNKRRFWAKNELGVIRRWNDPTWPNFLSITNQPLAGDCIVFRAKQ